MNYRADYVKRHVESVRMQITDTLGDAHDVPQLREAFDSMVGALISLDDQGWEPLFGLSHSNDRGFSLDNIKKVSRFAEEQSKSNTLMGRGLRLRNNHVFGRGYTFDLPTAPSGKVPPSLRKIVDDPDNQEVLFSPTAMKKNNRVLFNTGTLIVLWNKRTRKFSRLGVQDIFQRIAFDDDADRTKYYGRSYTIQNDLTSGEPKTVEEWIPLWSYADSNKALPASIVMGGKRIPVNRDLIAIDLRVNSDIDEAWGVPDCLAALPWAWAYNEYLKDGSKLLKAIAAIALQVKAKTAKAAAAAGAKLSNGRVAQQVITGPDTTIESIPRTNVVDLYTGRPIAANVAAALDVSVTAITTDTGKGGSYGSEQTLTLPEQLSALGRQEDFIGFFSQVFRAIGHPEAVLNFKRLSVDPIHRQVQSLGLAFTLGGISQKELRAAALELLDIQGDIDTLPEPNAFTGAKTFSLEDDPDADNRNDSDPNARQGNSGAVGKMNDSNSTRDDDAAASE